MTNTSLPVKKSSGASPLKNPTLVRAAWQRFQKIPFGKCLFSKIMGWIIPYTGSISPSVQKIEPGYAEVQLKDRRRVRNHLKSVHALALANIGEFCTGLALFSRSPAQAQAILVELNVTYLKKARGLLTASSSFPETEFKTDTNYTLTAEIKDAAQEMVAVVKTTWRIRL
jgi:acyl-coenzyme A thioesterase PaaI-like protein